jgi:hypothetical protein
MKESYQDVGGGKSMADIRFKVQGPTITSV